MLGCDLFVFSDALGQFGCAQKRMLLLRNVLIGVLINTVVAVVGQVLQSVFLGHFIIACLNVSSHKDRLLLAEEVDLEVLPLLIVLVQEHSLRLTVFLNGVISFCHLLIVSV